MTITSHDRETIRIWQDHGLPDDRQTREHAVALLGRLLAAHDEALTLVVEIAGGGA